MLIRRCLATILLTACLSATASAQTQTAEQIESLLREPMPRVPAALGDFTHPISSDIAGVQDYFDQGFQLMYAYGKYEAVRSFREAWKLDPECAICYWGEAWAWGPNINFAMAEHESPYAYDAIQKALELREHATAEEQALIDAMAVRYDPSYTVDQRRSFDSAFAEAMQQVSETYPDDLDVQTIYADSLFLLEERRGYRDIEQPGIRYLRTVLEGILERDIRHVGACHLYIHLTESTVQPELGEPCAEFIGNAVPGASHLNHMPSHTWNEVGRWGESVRANLQAWHSDQKVAVGAGVAIYPPHNLHMLFFAASYDGQGGVAMRAAKDYTRQFNDNAFEALVLLRFGRFDEILELTERPAADYQAGVWDFTQGYARLKLGEPEFAKAHLERLADIAATTTARVRFDPASLLLSVLEQILRGEILWQAGDLDGAIGAFELAVELEDDLNYDEPEQIPFAARHWLGAALLEAEEFRQAERAYRDELADHPHNGWSLFGLRQALAARGRTDSDVDADFEASWARADVWITASRF